MTEREAGSATWKKWPREEEHNGVRERKVVKGLALGEGSDG